MNKNIQEIYRRMHYTPVDSIDPRKQFKFKSLFHFIHNVEYRHTRGIRHARFPYEDTSYHQTKRSGFNSHDSFEAALQEVKTKKQPPSEVVELIKNKNRSKLAMTDSGGDGIDIPSYLSGSPDHFKKWERVETNNQTAEDNKTVFLSISANCSTSSSELTGYLKSSVLDSYKRYQRCQIVLYAFSKIDAYQSDGQYYWSLFIEIPTAEVETIFRCTYSDFFRRLVFYLKNQDPDVEPSLGTTMPHAYIEVNDDDGVLYTIN